jgi:hypothetical protein
MLLPEERPPLEVEPLYGLSLEEDLVDGLEAGTTQPVIMVLNN